MEEASTGGNSGQHSLVVWRPQPGPQANAICADWCPILLYGGAKYGGKTDFLLGDYLQDLPTYGKHWQGIIFRRALTEFTEIKLRAKELFPKVGGTWHEQASEWRFKDPENPKEIGAILRFKYVEKFSDLSLYEGHSYAWVGIDELGDWDDQNAFFRCLSMNRYARVSIPTLRLRATCNPGGRGHAWIKKYFIDPAPKGYEPIYDSTLKCYRLFIPAKLEDNVIGLKNDPNYENRLMRVGSPALVRALRYGDWHVVAGAYFSKFSPRNIIEPVELPSWLTRFMAYDPGSSDPFAFTWWAVNDGSIPGLPVDALICYREWNGEKEEIDGERIRGLKLPLKEIADGIKAREGDEKILYRVAGIDLWDTRKGPHDAERFSALGLHFIRAETKRKLGWKLLHERIEGDRNIPSAYWFKTCVKCIEHIPLLQHDKKDAEDVEASPNDHIPDTCRYAVMSRPWKTYKPTSEKSLEEAFAEPSIQELWDQRQRMMNGRR